VLTPPLLLACAACGLLSGLLAGLLGIGGGLVVVPVLLLLWPAAMGEPTLAPQVAVATSLAAMVPTTVTALLAQHRRGGVDKGWLGQLAPGACVGALIGALLMPWLDPRAVAVVFLVYASWFSARLALSACGRVLPTPWHRWPAGLMGTGIGIFSVLAGVGGAIFTVPYLESRAVPIARAVGTASGVALSLSLVAVASLAWGSSAALVWWPAALVIGLAAVATAPLGVRLAHRWPVARLKRAFACLLMFATASSMWKLVAM
jgi:uncharacterized protein